MTEGTVAKWLKKVGDKINEGDILAEIETDKATMEFESFNSGTLLHIGIPEGQTAAVDSLLAIIGEPGEKIDDALKGGDAPKAEAPKAEEKAEEKTTAPVAENQPNDQRPATSDQKIPAGVTVVTMPRLSDTMTEGTVAKWLKKVGDKVAEGDILAEIETDKATMEFESFNAGTLLFIGINDGQSAPVDSVLAIIGPEGTDVTGVAENFKKGGAAQASTSTTKDDSASGGGHDTFPWGKSEEKHEEVLADGKRIFISPLARKMAEEKGINISQVKGSGENGRIVRADIENFTPAAATQSAAPTTTAPAEQKAEVPVAKPYIPVGKEETEEIKNNQMRKVIAKRLSESAQTAPVFYLTIEVLMDNAMTAREAINAMPETKVSFNDMVIKACAMALRKHPKVNSTWKEDATLLHKHIHVGVAVAVEDGLLVPVLKFADQMTLTQIGGNVRDLAGKAKNKKIQPAEMEGSTFTVSNLGMFGISEFTSIINQPNSAILSVGAIEQKPVVKDGQIVVGNTMKVTLACDHRTVDGATGAQFLQTLRTYLENPVTMLA